MGDTSSEASAHNDAQRYERRAHLLARMAGNIASGMMSGPPDPKIVESGVVKKIDKSIAVRAVNIAREILGELGL
jgi:hypothetical protein